MPRHLLQCLLSLSGWKSSCRYGRNSQVSRSIGCIPASIFTPACSIQLLLPAVLRYIAELQRCYSSSIYSSFSGHYQRLLQHLSAVPALASVAVLTTATKLELLLSISDLQCFYSLLLKHFSPSIYGTSSVLLLLQYQWQCLLTQPRSRIR